MQILTSAEMSAADRGTAGERVVALCGKGNNGGDGLVAARVLAAAGVDVEVLLLGRADEVKGEADHPSEQARRGPRAVALRRLREDAPEVEVREVVDEAALAAASGGLERAELVIDAVVGTGFKPPLRGLAAAVREMVAKVNAVVVAVDLPSGWDANSMEQRAEGAFRADAVVTFTRPKLAHVFGSLTGSSKNGGAFGPVVVAEVGSPDAAGGLASGVGWAGAAE